MGFANLQNTIVARNQSKTKASGGIWHGGSVSTAFTNCTIADNQYGGCVYTGNAATRLWNSIIWGNGTDIAGTVSVAYCCFENAQDGVIELIGNTNHDPLFHDAQFYHLQSHYGVYDNAFFSGGSFVRSTMTSPLIDAGDPADDFSKEPNHSRGIEVGAYGNTPAASFTMPPGLFFIIR